MKIPLLVVLCIVSLGGRAQSSEKQQRKMEYRDSVANAKYLKWWRKEIKKMNKSNIDARLESKPTVSTITSGVNYHHQPIPDTLKSDGQMYKDTRNH